MSDTLADFVKNHSKHTEESANMKFSMCPLITFVNIVKKDFISRMSYMTTGDIIPKRI